jgi:GNAT superfamily N-acetyltransferase
MKVRALEQQDLPALLALYHHLNPSDVPLPEQRVVESVWSESLANPRMRHFGGFEGDLLVSACTICSIPNLTRGCRPYALVENVVTASTHRRKGWGRAVLAEAIAFAWSENCYKVMLLTGRKDEGVFNFYRSAGFSSDEKNAFIARPVA